MNKIRSSKSLKYLQDYYSGFLSFLKDVLESVSGTEQDFTTGKLGRAILLLSIPMVLEMLMESVFAVVDIYFVSKLSADAVAVVGITESLMTIVYAIGIGFSAAATAMVSRRIGEKDHDGASASAGQAIIVSIAASMLIAVPGIFFASDILLLMGIDRQVASVLSGYTAIMLGSNVVIMLLFVINAIFRSAGDAAISMRVLWMANILNMVLDPILIFGLGPVPALGIEGAAIATTTGRGLAVTYQFYLLFSGKRRISITVNDLRASLVLIKKLLRLSAGGIGQNLIATSSWIFLMRIISEFGNEVLAGYTIAIRVIIFFLLPSFGISNAAATLVGQNLGAGKPERAEKAVWITGLVNVIFLGIVGIFFITVPGSFVGIFTSLDDVALVGTESLRIISYGFLAYGVGMVLINSLNGAGDTLTPAWINFFCFWLIEIPLAYYLAMKMNLDQKGVFWAIVIAETLLTLTAAVIFSRGKWKNKTV